MEDLKIFSSSIGSSFGLCKLYYSKTEDERPEMLHTLYVNAIKVV